MSYAIECPGCQEALRVPDHAGGRRAKCPTCDATMRVPNSDEFVEPLDSEDIQVNTEKPKRKRKTLLDYEDEMAPSLRKKKKPKRR